MIGYILYGKQSAFFIEAFACRTLCNSGATLWLGGTTSLIDCNLVLLDVRFSNRSEGADVLNVVFPFSFYEVCWVMDDSKDLLVLSTGDVTAVATDGRRQ